MPTHTEMSWRLAELERQRRQREALALLQPPRAPKPVSGHSLRATLAGLCPGETLLAYFASEWEPRPFPLEMTSAK